MADEKRKPHTQAANKLVAVHEPQMETWTRRLAKFTAALVAFTAALVITSAVSDYFIYRQWTEMKSSSEQVERAIAASNRLADLNKGMLVTAARPKLTTRQMQLRILRSVEPKGILLSTRHVWANTGGLPAYIVEMNTTALTPDGDLDPIPDYSTGLTSSENDTKLKAGQFMVSNGGLRTPISDELLKEIESGTGPHRLVVIGYVKYKDDAGTVRQTAFARTYDPRTKRFVTINDPDYEYSD